MPDGVEIFAINGPLFFGVADRFQSTLDAMETPPKVFIMYLHNTPAIDMTGIHALEAFLERRQEGCRVLFAAVQEPARRTLQRSAFSAPLAKRTSTRRSTRRFCAPKRSLRKRSGSRLLYGIGERQEGFSGERFSCLSLNLSGSLPKGFRVY